MAFRDLREYIARLEEEGEIQRIGKAVDWHLEMGAIIRRSYDLRAPAPFFENIKGYGSEYRVFGAPLGLSRRHERTHSRMAISLGMRSDASLIDIMETFINKKKNPIPPVMVSDGPCKENVHLGDDVDLEEFPVPFLHDGDGGRYLGTWHIVVNVDPDSEWTNWGTYRLMLHDRKSLGILINPIRDIGHLYHQKYEARGRPMEFAVAFGADPVVAIVGGLNFGSRVSEAEIAGGIRQEPVELVKCETVDLLVPASSEIVIEGEIAPYERREEGPLGEYTGYRAGERAPRPVCRVKAVTHRDNPILPVSCPGVPVYDGNALGPLYSALLLDELRERGFPIRMIYFPLEGCTHLCVVSTQVPYPGYTRHLASAIWGSSEGKGAFYLMIVDDDVDVTNTAEVLWALSTRCHPDRGIFKMPNVPGSALLPFLTSEEKTQRLAASVLFDCTWPKDWPKEDIPVKASFDVVWPPEIQERVLRNWTEYGYTPES